MINHGAVVIPQHSPDMVRDYINDTKPSLIACRTECCSAEQIQVWRNSSPGTIILVIDGGITDSHEAAWGMNNPQGYAQEFVDACVRWKNQGWGNLFAFVNEPHIEQSADYRRRFVESTVRALQLAHAQGINLAVGRFSNGWPFAMLDDENWWPEFKPIIDTMAPGDYLELHEYWDVNGPISMGTWPWMAGKHRLCPYGVPILIGEYGIDRAVAGLGHHGWVDLLTTIDYYEQCRAYVAGCDPRVKGVACFLMDFQSADWYTFDIRLMVREGVFSRPWQRDNPFPVPVALPRPVDGVVTQKWGTHPEWYPGMDGHNGWDYGVTVGTPVRAVSNGRVYRERRDTNGYGTHMHVNHGWGSTIYGHLSDFTVPEQADVVAGQVIGLSGNTGFSTGPHLHFGVRVYGEFNSHFKDWIDPARFFEAAPPPVVPPVTPQVTTPIVTSMRWNTEEAVREIEHSITTLQSARQRLLDNVISQFYILEGIK